MPLNGSGSMAEARPEREGDGCKEHSGAISAWSPCLLMSPLSLLERFLCVLTASHPSTLYVSEPPDCKPIHPRGGCSLEVCVYAWWGRINAPKTNAYLGVTSLGGTPTSLYCAPCCARVDHMVDGVQQK